MTACNLITRGPCLPTCVIFFPSSLIPRFHCVVSAIVLCRRNCSIEHTFAFACFFLEHVASWIYTGRCRLECENFVPTAVSRFVTLRCTLLSLCGICNSQCFWCPFVIWTQLFLSPAEQFSASVGFHSAARLSKWRFSRAWTATFACSSPTVWRQASRCVIWIVFFRPVASYHQWSGVLYILGLKIWHFWWLISLLC